MKRLLLLSVLMLTLAVGFSQSTTYYWVGGSPATPATVNTGANWKTNIDGTGTSRPSSTGENDILVFDGTNLGGSAPATGQITINVNAGLTFAQMKFVNNANVVFIRGGTGTSTLTVKGENVDGDDLVIESGSSLSMSSTVGSIVFALEPKTTARVSGNLSMVTTLQSRIGFTATAGQRSLVFTNGSKFTSNITASSAAYAFGSNTPQASEKWVTFEAGSSLYYEGGHSPMGNSGYFSAIDFKSGSTWYHKATTTLNGSFFNRKSFANIVVEPGAILNADGPIHRIENVTVRTGGTLNLATSGQTAILGNLTVDGIVTADPASTNNLVLAGTASQTISGSGTVTLPSLTIADNANVQLNKSITVNNNVTVFGKLNFANNQINGTASFSAKGAQAETNETGSFTSGSYMITGAVGTLADIGKGLGISGTGIAPNTTIVSASSSAAPLLDTIFLSKPTIGDGANVALKVSSRPAVLETGNANGFDPVNGSLIISGNRSFEDRISYIINTATNTPFGLSTVATSTALAIESVTFNAAATTNSSVNVYNKFELNSGKITIRPLDTIHLQNGVKFGGFYTDNQYIITETNVAGDKGVLQVDGLSKETNIPVGSSLYYLPFRIEPSSISDFAVSVFHGITIDGTPNGTPLTAEQKKLVVDAVWDINRTNGSGDSKLYLHWPALAEGSSFATLPSESIGIIRNKNPNWSAPEGFGNNFIDSAWHTYSAFGRFAVATKPPTDPFVFNALPGKTYGNPDFDAGVISANTTSPIVYTSSNTSVATIVNNNIHIVGAGTTTITATQVSDGINPAATVSQTLVVDKAELTVTADNKTKPEGNANPALTATYTGFVNNETASVLTTPVALSTTATTASAAGIYPITVGGGAAANYNITYVNGTLTVTPRQAQTITFNAPAAKTYGNANFAAGATSTNATIPITYTSSNTNVATIVGTNIRIVGAGTATITASQAGSDLYFPATPVSRTLTVSKANLTIRAVDTTRAYGEPNPNFRITYTGFVSGENSTVLTTQPTVATTATTTSAPGYYPITLQGAAAANYNIIYTEGRLTILPQSGADQTNLQAFMSNSTTLTVRVYGTEPDLANLVIYDISGKPVVTRNIYVTNGFLNFTIPVNHLASGAYTVSVKGTKITLRKNITIVR